jgi:hypothetical protein
MQFAMSDKNDEYPVATLHTFLQEASTEFRRIRFQALVNLIGSIVLLLFLSRFLFFVFGNFGPPPFNMHPFEVGEHAEFEIADWFLLLASLAAVLWSLNVLLKQRKFVSRWGERFEKLEALERKFLPDEPS